MEFKTKYEIGQLVYYLSENDQLRTAEDGHIKIIEGIIEGIHTESYSSTKIKVIYILRVSSKHIRVNEEFVSKDIRELFKVVLKNAGENYRIKLR